MTEREILSHIDHTQLKAVATWADIQKLCGEAVQYGTASVCIPPSYVRRVAQHFPQLNICTVIGFPLGYATAETKEFEVRNAIENGANEVDMVVNLGDVKDGEFARVTQEIARLKRAAGDKILKVIVETCYLTGEEKQALCRCVSEAGADYIKTSTGFGTGGATIEDVALFKESIGPGVRIKAAGGVRTRKDLERFLEAGCERIGTSSAVALLTSGKGGDY